MSNATKVVHQQEKIFTLLKMHGNDRGYVKGLDIDHIARLTGITSHDVAKTLWGLQKRGLIGFSEKKGTGGHSIPYRFRVTKKGLDAGQEEVSQAKPIDPPEEEMVETEVEFRTNDPAAAALLDGATITVRPPRRKNPLVDLANKEADLRFCASLLSDYGLDEIGVQVLEHVRLKDEELKELREFLELN